VGRTCKKFLMKEKEFARLRDTLASNGATSDRVCRHDEIRSPVNSPTQPRLLSCTPRPLPCPDRCTRIHRGATERGVVDDVKRRAPAHPNHLSSANLGGRFGAVVGIAKGRSGHKQNDKQEYQARHSHLPERRAAVALTTNYRPSGQGKQPADGQ